MNNLKFLSLIGYAPMILKPEVNNNYVVRFLNPVSYSPSPTTNGVTLSTFLPNQPFQATRLQVRNPLSSFYLFNNPFLSKLIPALASSNPHFTLFTYLTHKGGKKGVRTKCRETKYVSPFARRVNRGWGFAPVAREYGKKRLSARQKELLQRDILNGATVRRGISRFVKVSKVPLTGPFNALNAFTRFLRKRISYLTLMVQFNGLIYLIKKMVKKHIADPSVNVVIKKLNLLFLTFFKYIGSLSVDFWKVANICSNLPYTGPMTIAVVMSGFRIAYGSHVGEGRWSGLKRETRLKKVFRRFPRFSVRWPFANSFFTLYPRKGFRAAGAKPQAPFDRKGKGGKSTPALNSCLLTPYNLFGVRTKLGRGQAPCPPFTSFTPKGGRPVGQRGLAGRDKFCYNGSKQRVIQAKQASISLFFGHIKNYKKMILEFSRYLKLFLYQLLWKWVQKRDTQLSQITLISKYWIFIQNNAKFYTLKP